MRFFIQGNVEEMMITPFSSLGTRGKTEGFWLLPSMFILKINKYSTPFPHLTAQTSLKKKMIIGKQSKKITFQILGPQKKHLSLVGQLCLQQKKSLPSFQHHEHRA